MRLAMQLPERKGDSSAPDADPRENMSAEVIDLASRNAFPGVAQRKKGSDALGLAAGVGSGGADRGGDPVGHECRAHGRTAATGPGAARRRRTRASARAGHPAAAGTTARPCPRLLQIRPRHLCSRTNRRSPRSAILTPRPRWCSMPVRCPCPHRRRHRGPSTGNSASDFASRIGGVGGGPAKAARMFDPQTTVTQGTLIPAVLETAIRH